MEEANNRKMNFFVRLYKSITNFDTYTQFASEPISKAIKYTIILVLVFSMIVTVFLVSSFKLKISNGISYLKENVEDISFKNKILSYNDDKFSIYNEEESVIPIVIVDTSENPNIEQYKEKLKLYNYGFILLRDRMMIYIMSQGVENQFTTISYSDYYLEDMSKEEILNSFDNIGIYIFIGIIMFITEFIQYFIYIMLNAIVLAVMGQLVAIILRLKMKFKETYKMGLYALTLPTLLELIYIMVNTTTGFVIPYFSWMYTTISYIYICVAILMIKTDFINMQRELIRIKMEENNDEEQYKLEEKQTDDENGEDEKKEEKNDEHDADDELKEQTDS